MLHGHQSDRPAVLRERQQGVDVETSSCTEVLNDSTRRGARTQRAGGSAADVAVGLMFHGSRTIRMLTRTAAHLASVVAGNTTVRQEPARSGRVLASSMCPMMILRSAARRRRGRRVEDRVADDFGVDVQPVSFAISLSAALSGSATASRSLTLVRGLLKAFRIFPRGRGRGRGGMAGGARNRTAVEADNTAFWPVDGTSEYGAASFPPGSRWRCGLLRQVGERALCGRNRR